MAARANPLFDIATPPVEAAPGAATPPRNALTQLARMHVEAVETARLANLLGRSLYVALALPVLGVLTVALGAAGLSPAIAWLLLVGAGCAAIGRAYAHAIRQPFERAALHAFAQDMSASLLYIGFAWGAGAFLALPAAAGSGAALLFAAVPALLIALLLRERQAVLLFLAPVAALTSLACVTRPFAGGTVDAGLVLIACAIVAGAVHASARWTEKRHDTTLPHALIAS